MADAFKASHPLIKQYYGDDDKLEMKTTEQRIAKGKMDALWDEYYALEGGRPRRDWLSSNLPELNEQRAVFSLPPLRLKNYAPPDGQLPISLDGGPLDDLQGEIYRSIRGVGVTNTNPAGGETRVVSSRDY